VSEIHAVAVITAQQASVDEVRAALKQLVPPTRAEEGCLDYQLYESAVAPGTFITTERWRAQADLDAHLGTEHLQTALAQTADHLAEPPGIHPLTPIEV
jgi:quinol monooxygenase YgiN